MSPAPIVPSTASVSACSATSASEWPARVVRVRDGDAAQHHGVARAEAVHVEAEGRCGFPSRCGKILGRGDLAVVLAAFDHHHLQSCAFGHRGVVGQGRRLGLRRASPRRDAPSAALRSGRSAASAPARGWCAGPCRRPRRRCAVRLTVSARRTPRTAPSIPGGRGGLQAGGDIHRPDEGPGGVMDRHEVGRLAGQRLEPVQDRLLAARPAQDGAGQVEALDGGRVVGFVAGGDHHLQAVDFRGGSIRLERVPQDRPAGQQGILLGQGAAEPAAAASRRRSGPCRSASEALDITCASGPCSRRQDPLLLAHNLCTAQVAYKLIRV